MPRRRRAIALARLGARRLAGGGIVERRRRLHLVRAVADGAELEALLAEYESRHTSDRERLGAMMQFAQSRKCRVQQLRAYFGEDDGAACGRCDNCRTDARHAPPGGVAAR